MHIPVPKTPVLLPHYLPNERPALCLPLLWLRLWVAADAYRAAVLDRSSLCGFVSGRGGTQLSAPDVSLTVRLTPTSKPATELAGERGDRRSAAAAAVLPLAALPPPSLRKLPMRGKPWSEEVSSSP